MKSDSSRLPEGWRHIALGSVGKWGSGGTPDRRRSDYYGGSIPWIKIGDLTGGRVTNTEETITEKGLAGSSAKLVDPGALLVSMYGASIGKLGITGVRCATNQAIAFCVPYPELATSEFLFQLLLHLQPTLIGQGKGGAQPNISQTVLKSLEIPLPTLGEQAQMVHALESIASRRESATQRLATARQRIKIFRQAVLAAASSGRLTADWRENHEGDAHQLAQELRHGSALRRKQLAEPQLDLLGELPSGWQAVALDSLIDHIEAGKSFSALGRPASDGEWGVIKVSAMSWGRFLQDENKAVPEDRTINPAYEIRTDDLLLSRANTEELVGATVLVAETRPRLLLSDKSLRLVPRAGIDKSWLNFTLQSRPVRAQFEERATGTSDSMRNLSQAKILATTLPMPSTAEQQEIARRVDEILGLADRLQRRIEAAAHRVERSSQAVLAKAFRGELIPTVADQPTPKTADALGSEGKRAS